MGLYRVSIGVILGGFRGLGFRLSGCGFRFLV